MDEKIFFMIFNFGKHNKTLHSLAYAVAKCSGGFFTAVYIGLIVYTYINHISLLAPILAIPLIVLALNIGLRKAIKRTRPYKKHNLVLPFKTKDKYSMPSNHVASAVIIALMCFFVYMPLGIIMFVVSLVTGISRIIIGVHYPLDILSGVLISLFLGVVLYIVII